MYAQELTEIAILGLDRRPLPAHLKTSDVRGSTPEDATLLLRALARAHYQRKAATPLLQMTELPAAAVNLAEAPVCSERSAQHLHEILYGPYRPFLPEFLQALQAAGRYLPYRYLPAMLDIALKNNDLADVILALAGSRGMWLVQQVERWQSLVAIPDPGLWPLASLEERLRILQYVRKQNPAQGRALLCSTWAKDGVRERSKLLPLLKTGLSLAEEDFLEDCLREKHKEVRQIAARLLSLLPESALSRRIQHYAAIMFKRDGRHGSWEVQVPDQIPDDWQHDLINSPANAPGGAKAALIRQVVGSVHPDYWPVLLDARPEDVLSWWNKSQWSVALWQGLTTAVAHYQATHWADAIALYVQQHYIQPIPGLDEMLAEWSTSAALTQVSQHLKHHAGVVQDGSLSYYLLRYGKAHWPDEVALALIEGLQKKTAQNRGHSSGLWHYRALLRQAAAFKVNPYLLPLIEQVWHSGIPLWGEWDKDIQFVLQALAFRRSMLETLAV